MALGVPTIHFDRFHLHRQNRDEISQSDFLKPSVVALPILAAGRRIVIPRFECYPLTLHP
jgi:hypothetical protein